MRQAIERDIQDLDNRTTAIMQKDTFQAKVIEFAVLTIIRIVISILKRELKRLA